MRATAKHVPPQALKLLKDMKGGHSGKCPTSRVITVHTRRVLSLERTKSAFLKKVCIFTTTGTYLGKPPVWAMVIHTVVSLSQWSRLLKSAIRCIYSIMQADSGIMRPNHVFICLQITSYLLGLVTWIEDHWDLAMGR
jgi:hypothetical protein